MCSFCRKLSSQGNSSLALCSFQYLDDVSSDDGSNWSVSSSGTMCSEHYVRLRNKYLWSGRKEGCFKRGQSEVKTPESRWRREIKDINGSGADHRVQMLQFEIKQKDKMMKQLRKQNVKLKEECQTLKGNQAHLRISHDLADKLRYQIETQRKQSSRIDGLLKQIDKLATENSQLRIAASRNISEHKYEISKAKELKQKQHNSKKEVRFKSDIRQTRWKENFIQVFVELMTQIGQKEGFKIKESYSIKRKTKAAWRYLKQFMKFHYAHDNNKENVSFV